MKNIINLIIMIVLGLFVAIIIYPALHEFGHMFIAIIVGADLVEFNLFPIPNVLFDVGEISIASNVMIGAVGVILPFILSVTINSKRFWLWYIGLIINIICCVSFIISALGCALFSFSKPIENEDISQMLNFCPNTVILWMILFIILIAYTVIRICKSHPLKRCIEYFELLKNERSIRLRSFYLEFNRFAILINKEISSAAIFFVNSNNSFAIEGSAISSSKNSLGVTPRYSQM